MRSRYFSLIFSKAFEFLKAVVLFTLTARVTFFARAKKANQRKHAPQLVILFSYH
jgi:hypothetical protein